MGNRKEERGAMKRVNEILKHPLYKEALSSIRRAEESRIFCRHDMEHFLSVARLAWIYNLEEGETLSRELIYAAAMLHDMGRAREYEDGTPHQEAGAELAEEILPACGFSRDEWGIIRWAIRFHRAGAARRGEDGRQPGGRGAEHPRERTEEIRGLLGEYLYRADKQSRACFSCKAQRECNWPAEKRNLEVEY